MFKKILIGALSTIVIGAAGAGAYNAQVNTQTEAQIAVQEQVQVQQQVQVAQTQGVAAQNAYGVQAGEQAANAQSNAYSTQSQVGQYGGPDWANQVDAAGSPVSGRGGNQARGGGSYTGVPNPQATPPEWLTVHGVISEVTLTDFALLTDAGELLRVDKGNQYYLESLGLSLEAGDAVLVTGYWMDETMFVAGSITLDETGVVYILRDEFGRPLWSGGANGGGRGRGGQ